MAEIEFFFDLSSPWTRIAFQNVQPLARETGSTIIWRPFLVGGVFNAVNNSVYVGRADPDNPKIRMSFKWMKDWARLAGVPMNFPSPHHPVKSVRAMRACCVLEDNQADLFRFADQAFDAYFNREKNLDDPAVLVEVANAAGFDGAALIRRSENDDIKQRLRTSTQEVIDRGGFGSPTIFIDKTEMFFGNDQLPLVRQAIREAAA
jgi:2-hydroxychromene-2-carboxylate isomerase